MVVEPMNSSMMDNYRTTLKVNGAPSFIDNQEKILPVAIISPGVRDFSFNQVGSNIVSVQRASAGTTTVTVPQGKIYVLVFARIPKWTSTNYSITVDLNDGSGTLNLLDASGSGDLERAIPINVVLRAGASFNINHSGLVTYEVYSN